MMKLEVAVSEPPKPLGVLGKEATRGIWKHESEDTYLIVTDEGLRLAFHPGIWNPIQEAERSLRQRFVPVTTPITFTLTP